MGEDTDTAVNMCEGTSFDSKVLVFEGSCTDLVCVGGNDDACGVASAFSWFAEAGKTYYILVSPIFLRFHSDMAGVFFLSRLKCMFLKF
jgi:hypothetical protein